MAAICTPTSPWFAFRRFPHPIWPVAPVASAHGGGQARAIRARRLRLQQTGEDRRADTVATGKRNGQRPACVTTSTERARLPWALWRHWGAAHRLGAVACSGENARQRWRWNYLVLVYGFVLTWLNEHTCMYWAQGRKNRLLSGFASSKFNF